MRPATFRSDGKVERVGSDVHASSKHAHGRVPALCRLFPTRRRMLPGSLLIKYRSIRNRHDSISSLKILDRKDKRPSIALLLYFWLGFCRDSRGSALYGI